MRWPFARRRTSQPHPARSFRPGVSNPSLEPRTLLSNLPAGFSDSVIIEGLRSPTAMAFAPDGALFVAEKNGAIRLVHDGHLQPTPVLQLRVDTMGERGISGLAFDPNFAQSPYLYVYYTTANAPVHNRLSRFTIDGGRAVPGSERVLLDLPPAQRQVLPVHNGGSIQFGLDGKLFLTVGDHYQPTNGQDLTLPFGKILRMNLDGSVPADNPFVGRADGVNPYIWAYGLRNPYTSAMQPGTGRFFVNDVGMARSEEINEIVRGGNYGWPIAEGYSTTPGLINPLYAYGHGNGPNDGCAIVGGAFVPEGGAFPASLQGYYLFSDFCKGTIRLLDLDTGGVTNWGTNLIGGGVDLDFGPDGALYYLTRTPSGSGGEIHRISYEVDQPPRIATQPADQQVAVGGLATFRTSVSGSEPLAFQWLRSGAEIPGANGPALTLNGLTAGDHGVQFQVRVSNPFGTVLSAPATLRVVQDQAPIAMITQPRPGFLWRRGQAIRFAGNARDAEDGRLRPRSFTWQVDLHHDEHVHPFLPPTSGRRGGVLRIPRSAHDPGVIWYRIILTVTDSAGISTTVTRDLYPRPGQA